VFGKDEVSVGDCDRVRRLKLPHNTDSRFIVCAAMSGLSLHPSMSVDCEILELFGNILLTITRKH
jgi:hypothetical protein